ncbi:Uncharacterised protein [Mycolicibacterium thermoresistibile]|nr:hypothetical protein [Mycolicibacterium thermoresistibile]GAT16794.1 putative uncharacterized protein [Mycolicibacterium thermoresistibile]SNW17922.1 Uncharacterised protein [Mycolicibacterium thermoresistibile]
MAWYLALQGPAHTTNQALIYQLGDDVDVDKIADDMASAATIDRVVPIPVVLQNLNKPATMHVRPASWGVWTFYELSDEERKKLPSGNPLLDALAQAARQQQAKMGQQGQQPGQQIPEIFRNQ